MIIVLLVDNNCAVFLIWYDHGVVIVIKVDRVDCHSYLLTSILALLAHLLYST